ncbi:aminomethyl transferase family protein [candidate division KSB1 bacterium]|nr:aminomethyl transferase family protein [candidate division KSB1 bacterium]
MPIPTPFHPRTSELCKSHEWRNWSGYLAAIKYGPTHDHEYYAIRNSAGLIDVNSLFKYEITGPDAAGLVDRIITRDVSKCKVGQVLYTSWCDEAGKMIDDGTVQRLEENYFRITAADPSLRWFQDCGLGMNVKIENVSEKLCALALQGPRSRDILKEIFTGPDLDSLKFFWLTHGEIDGFPITITRTGYTGDLGYELWVDPENALKLWDALMETGRGYGITPAGLDALDVARIEAGLLLIEVDYISSMKALIEARKSSPFEAGLGWSVKLDNKDFVGRKALLAEKEKGSKWNLVGLEVKWQDIEKLFDAVDLPPLVAGTASRLAVPVYKSGKQIGQATSSTFSPLLKKQIALATLKTPYAEPGTKVNFEITVEFVRHIAEATVVQTPFFNPERKRAISPTKNTK